MKEKEYTLITFKSTHYAIGAEEIFEAEDMDFKTIPTPREVSHSCGLSILFGIDDLEKVKVIVQEKNIKIDGLYRFLKGGANPKTEKIL